MLADGNPADGFADPVTRSSRHRYSIVSTNGRSLMKKTGTTQSERGFTLLELLLAVFILTVGLLAVVSLETTAINSNSLANKLSVATSLSQAVMEDLLSKDISDPVLNTPVTNAIYYGLDQNNLTASNLIVRSAGTYTATYSAQPNTPVLFVTRLDVTVVGGGRTVTLTGFKRVR
jgi:prepilin-type N-terminal cleavage/methylation domain-containing protein